MSLKYKYLEFDGEEFLTVYVPGEAPLLASRESHANFDRLVEMAKARDLAIVDEFDTGRAVQKAFDDVIEGRVAVRGGVVFYDDDPQDGAITKTILRFLEEGISVKPLVAFMDNIMANPQEESREQFFRWIEHHDFPIDSDGFIVAYKGVAGSMANGFTSISSGTAFVNGEEKVGKIPNAVGDVVTMPRSEVQHDPHVACHKGLHAGTWEYASGFSQGAVMHVRINPRDVVSVPHDCTSQKVRVCRYEVIGFAEAEHGSAHWKSESAPLDEEVYESNLDDEYEGHWYDDDFDEDYAPDEDVAPKVEYVKSTPSNTKVGSMVRRDPNAVVVSDEGKTMAVGRDYTVKAFDTLGSGGAGSYVRLQETKLDGGVWLRELLVAVAPSAIEQKTVVRDTRDNHKSQPRDAKGHFIKKV